MNMNQIVGPHPGVCAFLLAAGGCLVAAGVYGILGPVSVKQAVAEPGGLSEMAPWLLVGLGVLLWYCGALLFGRARGLSPWLSLLLGSLTLPGIAIMAIIGKPLTPHEAWERQNPEMAKKRVRREYRDVKPLY
jgi:hypothetical protein